MDDQRQVNGSSEEFLDWSSGQVEKRRPRKKVTFACIDFEDEYEPEPSWSDSSSSVHSQEEIVPEEKIPQEEETEEFQGATGVVTPYNAENTDRLRMASPGECPRYCGTCQGYVPKIREHLNARHLPWWVDAVSACKICQGQYNLRRRLDKHKKECHPKEDVRLSPQEWEGLMIPFFYCLVKKLGVGTLEGLVRFVQTEGLALARDSHSHPLDRMYYNSAFDGCGGLFKPEKPRDVRDLTHWRTVYRLTRKACLDCMEIKTFEPLGGNSFVIPLPEHYLAMTRPGEEGERWEEEWQCAGEVSPGILQRSEDKEKVVKWEDTREKSLKVSWNTRVEEVLSKNPGVFTIEAAPEFLEGRIEN